MPIPRSLAALTASLLAACSAPPPARTTPTAQPEADICPYTLEEERTPDSVRPFSLGPHRFCVSERLFNDSLRLPGNGRVVDLGLDWPSLEPLPLNFDYEAEQETFLSTLRIRIEYIDRLSDADYLSLPDRWAGPLFPGRPEDLKRPDDNLSLRIKGDPVHGLTPYYADLDRIRRYYVELNGPTTKAGLPEDQRDWFLGRDSTGALRTVIKCSVAQMPDGVGVQNGRLVHDPSVFRRAVCTHQFIIPEYKLDVYVVYQRIMLPDWQRLESRVREILRAGKYR